MKIQQKFNKVVGFVPTFFKAMKSKDTPPLAKAVGLLAISYAIMPADFIADVIPVIGLLDDAIVLPFLMYLATTMLPENHKQPQTVKVETKDYVEMD